MMCVSGGFLLSQSHLANEGDWLCNDSEIGERFC